MECYVYGYFVYGRYRFHCKQSPALAANLNLPVYAIVPKFWEPLNKKRSLDLAQFLLADNFIIENKIKLMIFSVMKHF